jgi:hypothetical protein
MKLPLFLMVFVNVHIHFRIGPGSGTLKFRIWFRIWQKFQILAYPDPQHWLKFYCMYRHFIWRRFAWAPQGNTVCTYKMWMTV